MFDALSIASYIQEESGKTLISSPPYAITTALNLLTFNDWGSSGYTVDGNPAHWGQEELYAARVLFKLKQAVPLTSIRIRGDGYSTSIQLVSPSGTTLGLYSYAYGGVPYSTRTIESIVFDGVAVDEITLTWDFPEFLTEYFVVGSGGGGYPQEFENFITGLWTDPAVIPPKFWTNLKGQREE